MNGWMDKMDGWIYPSFDVKLADEIGLHNKLGDVLDFDADALLDAVRHQDLRRHRRRRIDPRAEARTAPDTRPDPLTPSQIHNQSIH